MEPLTVNRSDFYWALDAVLPHVGPDNRELDFVGFHVDGSELRLFASDSYTLAIARLPFNGEWMKDIWLTPKEARDLLRFIRPTLKAHHEEDIALAVSVRIGVAASQEADEPILFPELHVAKGEDSEVYDLRPATRDYENIHGFIRALVGYARYGGSLIFSPDLLKRFGKAEREVGDRLRLFPSEAETNSGQVMTAAYLTCGPNFIGAIAGMSDKDIPLEDNLATWGFGEEE